MRMGTRNGGRTAAFGAFLAAMLFLAACGSKTPAAPATPPPATAGPVQIFPGTASVPVGQQVKFTAFLSTAPEATFTWSITSGSGNGSIDANGVYTAPGTIPSNASVTVTATASGSSSGTGTATVTITAAQGLVVGLVNATSPTGTPGATDVTLAAGAAQTFSASSNGTHVSPTWEVNGTPGGDNAHGTISADGNGNGVYLAPLTPPPGGSATITAVSAGNSGNASATVLYSNRSLNGPYAFSYTGNDTSGPLAAAGSFTANAAAGTLAGIEDYNSGILKAPAQAVAITGTFSINPDGSGVAMVSNSATSSTDTWQLALTSAALGGVAQHVLLVRFDSKATGSGAIDQQTPSALALSAFTGNYVFALSGFDTKSLPLEIMGKFQAQGPLGSFLPNASEEDFNDGGTSSSAGVDTTLQGSYFLDPAQPNTGRGLVTLINTNATITGTRNFTFYLVDGTHLKVIENDLNAFLAGDFYSAPNTNGTFATSILNGGYAFTLGGATADDSGVFAEGGVLSANGSGAFTSGETDENNSGTTALRQAASGSYTVDPGFGRLTISLSVNNKTRSLAGYTTSAGALLLIDLDTDVAASGQALRQTSVGSVDGNLALNFAGLRVGKKSLAEADVVGQVQSNAALDSITGSVSVDNAGTTTNGLALTSASSITAPDSLGHGTVSLAVQSSTFGAAYYVVNQNEALTMGTDTTRASLGVLLRKF